MSPKNKKTYLLLVSMSAVSLLVLVVLAWLPPVETATADMNLAQATQPVQPSPSATTSAPAESMPGGTRPTTPAPEPATPTADAQKDGAKAALPAAPPEKIAPPMDKK
jgi:hypothetical protein